MRPTIKYGLLSVCLLTIAIFGLYILLTPPKGYIYYFPENYAGWICIEHNVNGATPLPELDGYLIIKVPANGILKTSSPLRTSHRRDKYFYYNGTQIRAAKELEFGGSGGTIQNKVGEGPIMGKFWISTNVKKDYDLYVKGFNFVNSPCGPFVK